ncbi:MAG TPA: FAD-binding oxidoreductase [Arachidicoccus sp.]
MPSMPKWMNNAVENLLSSKFREVSVLETEPICKNLKRVKFSADLHGLEYFPGYAVSFRVNNTDYRNYTPYNFDKVNGYFEILFHLHGKGSGSEFADMLNVQDKMKMFVPRGKRAFMFANQYKYHYVVGDETVLGFALEIKQEAEKHDYKFNATFELDNHDVLKMLELYGSYVHKNEPQKIMEQIMCDIFDGVIRKEETAFYISGNGETLQYVRKELKQLDILNVQIFAQAYWIDGKKGL